MINQLCNSPGRAAHLNRLSRRSVHVATHGLRVDDETNLVRGQDPAEVAVDTPGQQVVLDRLLDWMLVCTLREWFDRPGGEPPAWWAAQQDPVVGDALRLLHAEPAAPWTVAVLADRTGGVAFGAGQAVRRPGRRTAADLPHPLADDARGRPAGRAGGRNHRGHCPHRGLLQPIRVQRSVQTGPRRQPKRVPAHRDHCLPGCRATWPAHTTPAGSNA